MATRVNEMHGLTSHPLYTVWVDMRRRCNQPRCGRYKDYGAKGIKVCERWNKSFKAFLDDMGECPPGMSLDRYPNQNGDYEPTNCRWADDVQQNTNRSNVKLYTHAGKTMTLAGWAREIGVKYITLYARAQTGQPIERILRRNAS